MRLAATIARFVVVALWCGCAKPSYSPLSGPPAATALARGAGRAEVIVVPHEPAPVIGLDTVEAGPNPAMTHVPVAPPPAMTFGRGWIPLATWSSRCGTGQPERIVSGGTTIFRIPTATGVCELTMGSRLSRWNGRAVWLGFAPYLVRGEPHIHALDAEKTLLPLAEGPFVRPTSIKTIVLDPGHGGMDGGTRGARDQLEKNYTLDWALRTERLLTNAGWKVFLTRRGDVDVSLAERVALADRARADLFLSLHFNSTFPQTQPAGIETYCLTPTGLPSTLRRGYSDDDHATYPNNSFDVANVQWAFRLHQSLLKETGAQDDGLKRARFMGVLRYQNRPAVLVEGGFLSNQRDAANIDSGAYREMLARAVADALP